MTGKTTARELSGSRHTGTIFWTHMDIVTKETEEGTFMYCYLYPETLSVSNWDILYMGFKEH